MVTTNKSAAVSSSSVQKCRGDHLIPDVLTAVFDFLDLNDLLRCMKTCRRWRVVSRDHPKFSRTITLRSLVPSFYSRFLAQILHKDREGGALRLTVTLLHDMIPRKLREMLKRVWPRMVCFSIEACDTESMVAILSVPSPRLEVLGFFNKHSRGAVDPELTAAFLGGHAPVLRSFRSLLVSLPSAPRLAVLANVVELWAGAYYIESFRNITLQFPRLQHLEIVDSALESTLGEADVAALLPLGAIPHITLQFRVYPQSAAYTVEALPLTTIRHLSIVLPQGPHDRDNITPGILHDIIESMPGDFSVVMHTALSGAKPGEYDLVLTSTDESGRKFQRDISLGIHLQYLGIPESICMRIVRLAIHAPDWDRTCFWMYGLQRLDILKLVFPSEALLRDLLRPERTFKRRPVPMSFMHTTLLLADVPVGKKIDVDYGLLHAFLRKGTMQPCIPLSEQHVFFYGLKVAGEAEIVVDGESDTPRTVIASVTETGTFSQPPNYHW